MAPAHEEAPPTVCDWLCLCCHGRSALLPKTVDKATAAVVTTGSFSFLGVKLVLVAQNRTQWSEGIRHSSWRGPQAVWSPRPNLDRLKRAWPHCGSLTFGEGKSDASHLDLELVPNRGV